MNQGNKKALFLDRDGVINHDPGDYTTSLANFTILPGVKEFLKHATDKGYAIVVITNQGGIAKQKYSLGDFYEINDFMKSEFEKEGINFIETFFCPHHDAIGNCICRKPKSGMIEKAIAKYGIDPISSIMIGDKWRDLDAAHEADVKGVKTDVNQDLRTLEFPEGWSDLDMRPVLS